MILDTRYPARCWGSENPRMWKGGVDKRGSRPTTAGAPAAAPAGRPESQAARIARLEAENAALRTEQAKLAEERDILRQAAKYFAGETNW